MFNMVNKYINIKYYIGLSLFEISITMMIIAIVVGTVGIFIGKPILFFTQITQEIGATAKLNVALYNIANDFAKYAGGIRIYSNQANTVSLQFNITNSTTITYTCDFSAGAMYRNTSIQGGQLLLNNVTSCLFRQNLSADNKQVFLNIRLGITKNNMPVLLTEILNAPNV